MDSPIVNLEERLLRDIQAGRAVSLEWALLVISGVQTEEGIRSYVNKVDDIFGKFLTKVRPFSFARHPRLPLYLHRDFAQCLFEYLWNSKPKRFGESFLFTDVIDAQLDADGNRTVGTCIGLTSLFSVLGFRAGLNLSLLVTSDHLLNRLRLGNDSLDIDHTDPLGFDCPVRESFNEFPLPMLIANVLNSRGLKNERDGRIAAAESDYGKAMEVNPMYANARNNRGNMRFQLENLEGAIVDYTEAIRLHPDFCEAYCNRGLAHQRLGRLAEAREDFHRAVRARAGYRDAVQCLQLLDAMERSRRPAGKAGEDS